MIIDAMDLLYSDKVDGFCIVSSDSDFTRLAIRLRESGMKVIGMGRKNTIPLLLPVIVLFISKFWMVPFRKKAKKRSSTTDTKKPAGKTVEKPVEKPVEKSLNKIDTQTIELIDRP
jgi:uncharacterized LabA/DUF88 family protein